MTVVFAYCSASMPEDHMKRNHPMTMTVMSHQYERQILKLLPVLVVAQQRDEIIVQRFQYGTSPVGAVVLFGLCLPGRGAKHSRAFWGQGGPK